MQTIVRMIGNGWRPDQARNLRRMIHRTLFFARIEDYRMTGRIATAILSDEFAGPQFAAVRFITRCGPGVLANGSVHLGSAGFRSGLSSVHCGGPI
jgi:hypothetical protein